MAAPEPVNPFVGPLAFGRRDASRFFGRGEEAEELLALVISEKVVLFYAQSGAGKTSLINARLVPDLEQEGFEVLPVVRVGAEEVEAPQVDNIYVFNALRYLNAGEDVDSLRLAVGNLPEFLAAEVGPSNQEATPRVLIIDQFEEILTAYPERWQEREGLFNQLRQALRDDSMLSLLLVMREDHIAGLDRYADLLPGGLHCRFRMERLRHEAALKAVRRPVESRRPFAPGVAEQLVDNLRQEHLAEQATKIAGEFVEPVQLQVVCYQLWEGLNGDSGGEITEAHLKAFGNVDRALEDFYESAVAGVAARTRESEAKIRRWFDATLITPSHIRSQVHRGASESGGLSNDAVDELVDAHLIRAERVRGGTWFELVHDRFIDPILASNRKWLGRSKRRRLAIAAVAAALLAVLGVTWKHHRDREVHRENANKQSRLALDTLRGHPPKSLSLALEAAKIARRVDRRLTPTVRDALRQALQASRARLVRRLEVGEVDQLFLDVSGSRLGALDPDGRLSVRDVDSGLELLTVGGGDAPIRVAALSGDGARVATFAGDEVFRLWGVDAQNELSSFAVDIEPLDLLFNADGRYLAATDWDGAVSLWETESGQKVFSFTDPEEAVIDTVFRPGGERFATAGDAGSVQVWTLDRDEPRLTLSAGEDPIVAFSPDGRSLVSVNAAGGALLWSYAVDGPPVRYPEPEQGWQGIADAPTQVISLDPEGLTVTLVSAYGEARSWDLVSNAAATVLPGDEERLAVATFSRDGRRLAIAREQAETEIWELMSDQVPRVFSGHEARVNAVAAGREGKLLASGSDDKTARIWDLESGRLLKDLNGHQASVNGVAFSPDHRRLATASDDHTARVWDLESGRLEQVLAGHANIVTDVAWSPGGGAIATASTDGTVRVWSAAGGELRSTLDHRGEEVRSVAFSPDGALLATAGGIGQEKGMARIWDVHSAVAITHLGDHSDLFRAVAFDPGGDLMATGGDDRTARIWKIRSAEVVFELPGHSGTVTAVAFAPDGARLATCDVNGTVVIWDVDSGKKDFTISGSSPIWDLALTPDGKHLVMGSGDARIRLEPLDAEDLIRLAEERTGVEPMIQVED